jgi:hypothetical protein
MDAAGIDFVSLGELAQQLGVQVWQIARLFELGIIPEPPRLSRRRVIPKAAIPDIIEGLRQRHWLPADGGPIR